MGLLSDPSLTPRNKFAKILNKHHSKVCWLLYIASIVWFGCLGHKDFNHGTYLSENALSPGLVYPEIKQDSSRWAQQLIEELGRERDNHRATTPHAWILAKMRQIGLETYVHNYTLRYPFAGGKEFQGKNVYGILRAPRTSSTEGLVFSAPYRSQASPHTDIIASVPVLLAFADFARKKNYWAKDIIFLVTEQEQLGMHAFIEAYFNTEMDKTSSQQAYLDYGYLPARAGSLQAALNIEVQDLDIDYVDVKIEGLNGQLPNLDMFNLVQRITSREGIISGYKQTPQKKRRQHNFSLESNIKNLLAMIFSQSTGVPNGNHGFFHRHRIEALTLEAFKRQTSGNNRYNGGLPLLKTIEGISRSLNNLLERFHQSYFFYILVQNDRFVSIGDYMPCLALLVVPLFIKSFLLWLIASGDLKEDDSEQPEKKETDTEDLKIAPAVLYILYACLVGYLCQHMLALEFIVNFLAQYGFSTAQSIFVSMLLWNLIAFALPVVFRPPAKALNWLYLGSLVGLGTTLVVVGLLNFSLAFLIAIVTVPLALGAKPSMNLGFRKTLLTLYCILLNPLVFIYGLVCTLTIFQFPELTIKEIAFRALTAVMESITFSLTDNLIYNNWLCTIVTAGLLPLWCCLWTVVITKGMKRTKFNLDAAKKDQ
ncbi:glycosylphosphatidylinositol anchor attachment 1 protein [Stomoxys calcitrans]|uniref:glycosylphosphatidylinositol anchor attachment 1 protein n=1 Tax=Stomoxys calcitrans TaxID=35570 RepID=UPI0027E22E75|nr:glycosylphosphatidylinositol anchor attachment 1 protein [Stomoxys calcitrans]